MPRYVLEDLGVLERPRPAVTVVGGRLGGVGAGAWRRCGVHRSPSGSRTDVEMYQKAIGVQLFWPASWGIAPGWGSVARGRWRGGRWRGRRRGGLERAVARGGGAGRGADAGEGGRSGRWRGSVARTPARGAGAGGGGRGFATPWAAEHGRAAERRLRRRPRSASTPRIEDPPTCRATSDGRRAQRGPITRHSTTSPARVRRYRCQSRPNAHSAPGAGRVRRYRP